MKFPKALTQFLPYAKVFQTQVMKNIDQFIERLFEGFNPNQRTVLAARFGLKTGLPATLQEVGDQLGITRERVRQIQDQAMKRLKNRVKEEAASLIDFANEHLEKLGGVERDDAFMADLRKTYFKDSAPKHLEQKARFMFVTAGTPMAYKEDDAMNGFWYSSETAKKKFLETVKQVTSFFRSNDKNELLREKAYLASHKDFITSHSFSIPKHFGENVFGDIGLREWPEIEPKTIRDKAYLVLRKHGKPLHFGDVARYINRYGIDKKAAHIQTVHNELIKDDRFVLVGRGMYGLKEHGFAPGTVREVVARLLKKNGPLPSKDVVRLVNQERFLKENTILLSLQNRRYFKRLDDGRYHVKEA